MFKNKKTSNEARKNSKKAIATKLHLLHTSVGLFQAHGYEQTTMRHIAKAAQVSLGSAYYYFESKEDIVLSFYQASLAQTLAYAPPIFEQDAPLKEKLAQFFQAKFQELGPHRDFLKVVAGAALDAHKPSSPFSEHNLPIRKQIIQMFDDAFAKESLKVGAELAPLLGSLIWHLQMGLLMYWLHDRSEQQANSQKLTTKSLKLLMMFLNLSSFPMLKPFNKLVVDILALMGVRHEAH